MVIREGFEPPTPALGRRRSNPLSYRTLNILYSTPKGVLLNINVKTTQLSYYPTINHILYNVLMPKTKKVAKKYFDDQFDDEEVLFIFRKHPIVMRKGLILGLFAWLIGPLYTLILTYVRPNDLPSMTFFGLSLAASILVGVLILFPSWISWYYSIFIVTDQRLIQITQKGLFNRSVVDLGLSKIQSTNYEIRGLQATLLSFGTIVIQTYMGDLIVHEVHHPVEVIRKIAEILRKEGIVAEELEGTALSNQEQESE
jgi:hypothetical protein